MSKRRFNLVPAMRAVVAGLALVCFAPGSAAGQAPRSEPGARTIPRTPEGHPDLQGAWWDSGPEDVVYTSDFETGYPDETARKVQGREFLVAPPTTIVDPPDGLMPYQPWATAKRQNIPHGRTGDTIGRKVVDRRPTSLRDLRPQTLCLVGIPRLSTNREFHVLQIPGYVVMLWEWGHAYRVIPLDARPRISPNVKLSMGDARGRWEGDTLVVETTNINDWDWFDGAGTFHSDEMSIVERFTMVDAGKVDYRLTVTDPKVFTRPWTIAFPLLRHRKPPPTSGIDGEPFEHACVEGERSIENVIEGGDPRRWPKPY